MTSEEMIRKVYKWKMVGTNPKEIPQIRRKQITVNDLKVMKRQFGKGKY